MVVLFTACLPKYSKILCINTAVNDFALQNYTKKMTLANKSAIFHVFRSFYNERLLLTFSSDPPITMLANVQPKTAVTCMRLPRVAHCCGCSVE